MAQEGYQGFFEVDVQVEDARGTGEVVPIDRLVVDPQDADDISPLAVRDPFALAIPVQLPEHLVLSCGDPDAAWRSRDLDQHPTLDLHAVEQAVTEDEEVDLQRAGRVHQVERRLASNRGAGRIDRHVELGADPLQQRLPGASIHHHRHVDVDGGPGLTEQRAGHRSAERIPQAELVEDPRHVADQLERPGRHQAGRYR